MNVSIERLRVWLLVGAGLLVMVIASFLGYAHYRAHRFLTNLPKKLGVNVRRETNGFTYSQSVQGRKEDRADRIYGKEFEYDQKNEVIRADGEVHIDLQAPEAADANAKMDYAAGKDLHQKPEQKQEHEAKDGRLIHVTTSG